MAHVNAMVALLPSFEKTSENPYGSIDLGDGYLLLRPTDGPHDLSCDEQEALRVFSSGCQASENVNPISIYQWGRLKLPTEQVVRSVWKELERCSDMARTDRNVKVCESFVHLESLAHVDYRYSIRT